MTQRHFDLMVIGGGSGGVRAARIAAQHGAKVALAEEYRMGGTCVIRGCVPKKLLVYGAEFGKAITDAASYGWTTGPATFSWSVLRDAVQAEVTRLEGLYRKNLETKGVTLFDARAVLEDPHTVRLATGETLQADKILIATGATPFRPWQAPGQEYAITSNEAFTLGELPKRILIAGGGYIAVEFASIFSGLGVSTTLLYRGDMILRGFDNDLRIQATENLLARGVEIITQAAFGAIEKIDAGYRATLTNGRVVETDLAFLAIGRTPNTKGLGLEKAGVQLTENGAIKVDAFSQTSADHIWAVGDVTDRIALTPVAIREGHAFADTVFGGRPTAFDHTDVPNAVFAIPPLSSVGLSQAEAIARFGDVHIYKTAFRPMKGIIAGDPTRTLMKLIVHPTDDRVLGVHIAGVDGPEMIQLAAIAVKAGLTKSQWDATCALHPTAAEELVLLRERAA